MPIWTSFIFICALSIEYQFDLQQLRLHQTGITACSWVFGLHINKKYEKRRILFLKNPFFHSLSGRKLKNRYKTNGKSPNPSYRFIAKRISAKINQEHTNQAKSCSFDI